MSDDTYSTGQRVLRAAFMALVGTGVGAIAALVLIRKGWITKWNPLPTFTVIGAGLAAVTGFWFSDYTWKRVLRILLPFSKWP